ncbi:MAG TPA: DUF2283 domain-containing protein [Thermoanaerobaculia bacterium]|nr:DUF2283 domain-containing protein [Thermoanaerobaculia bacterium]
MASAETTSPKGTSPTTSRSTESDEDKPGVILDYDDRGDLVSLEILDASQRVTEGRRIEFQMAE